MKRQLFLAVAGVICAFSASALDFPQQELEYDIQYHCTFIDECAAHATVTCSCFDNSFNATINGCSIPIFGTIYCVNDTLQSTFVPSGETLTFASENVDYMSGYYRKPHDDDRTNPNLPSSYRTINGLGTLDANNSTIEYVTLTADMLAMFYYAKSEEFESLQEGVAIDVPVRMPDGAIHTMQAIYQGVKQCCGRDAWALLVNFTYGDSLSHYPMEVYIDTELRIPTQFVASLTIGQLEMTYAF